MPNKNVDGIKKLTGKKLEKSRKMVLDYIKKEEAKQKKKEKKISSNKSNFLDGIVPKDKNELEKVEAKEITKEEIIEDVEIEKKEVKEDNQVVEETIPQDGHEDENIEEVEKEDQVVEDTFVNDQEDIVEDKGEEKKEIEDLEKKKQDLDKEIEAVEGGLVNNTENENEKEISDENISSEKTKITEDINQNIEEEKAEVLQEAESEEQESLAPLGDVKEKVEKKEKESISKEDLKDVDNIKITENNQEVEVKEKKENLKKELDKIKNNYKKVKNKLQSKKKRQKDKKRKEREKRVEKLNKEIKKNWKSWCCKFILYFAIAIIFVYLILALSLLKFFVDSSFAEKVTKYIHIPAVIIGKDTIGLNEYILKKKEKVATMDSQSNIREAILRDFVQEKVFIDLVKRYNLEIVDKDKEELVELLNWYIIRDKDINNIAYEKVEKLKEMINDVNNFDEAGRKYGSKGYEEESKAFLKNSDEVLNLGNNEVTNLLINEFGYYFVQKNNGSFKYIFIKGITLDEYIDMYSDNLKIWLLVK